MREDPASEWEEPNNYISWRTLLATAKNRQDELKPDMNSRRLMPIDDGAIHTTTLTVGICLFEIISFEPLRGFLESNKRGSDTHTG